MSTWSEKSNPDGQKRIDEAFGALHALAPGSLLANCGRAWHQLRGIMELYAEDGEHMNTRGAYLNACVLGKTVFGIDPLKLPSQMDTEAVSMKLSADEIRLLQKTAAMAAL
jgi:hypothetical protein